MVKPRQEFERALSDLESGCPAVRDQVALVRCLLADNAPAAVLAMAAIRMTQALEEARQAVYLQDRLRGQKVLQSAREGHRVIYGTPEDRKRLYAQHQATVNELHVANPRLSWTELSNRAGQVHGCAGRTIRRHADNPKQNGTLPGTVPVGKV